MELNSTLLQIDSLKKEAEGLKPVKPDWERAFWEKFRLEFNYNSNHMEGNTLTYGQTKLLLLFDRTTGDNKGREIEEMKAHDVALKMITELSADAESMLTEKLIREINELILVRPFYNDAITPAGQPTKRLITPGIYKKQPNSVLLPDGNMFYYASPEETPILMGELTEWYNQNKKEIHPVRLAALMHYKLVRIHPFDDSNGRTTRLVMNFILMQYGYAPVVIESKKKDNYLAALNKADTGDIEAFEEYIAGVSIRWQEIFLKAVNGEKIEEPEDFEKEVELLRRQLSKKEEVEVKKSKQVVEQIIIQSIFPLLENIEKKLDGLKSFFFENSIIINGANYNRKVSNISELKSSFQALISQLLDGAQMEIKFIHTDLIKTGKRKFSYFSTVKLSFNNYNYVIKMGQDKEVVIKKRYGHQLSEEELESIVENLAKKELESIKRELDRSTPI